LTKLTNQKETTQQVIKSAQVVDGLVFITIDQMKNLELKGKH